MVPCESEDYSGRMTCRTIFGGDHMRTVPTFTFSILTLASLEAAAALSATVPPAWLKAEVSLPEHSRSPLVVKLSPDMTPCRAKYGNEAASKCSRLFGLVSSRVTGISLSPAVEGVWRWEARAVALVETHLTDMMTGEHQIYE